MAWILSLTVAGLVAYLARVVKQKATLHEEIGRLKERVRYAEENLQKQKAITISAAAPVDGIASLQSGEG